MPTTLIVYDSVTPEIAYKFISKLSSSKRVGLSQQDFANTLTATCRELHNFVKNNDCL